MFVPTSRKNAPSPQIALAWLSANEECCIAAQISVNMAWVRQSSAAGFWTVGPLSNSVF